MNAIQLIHIGYFETSTYIVFIFTVEWYSVHLVFLDSVVPFVPECKGSFAWYLEGLHLPESCARWMHVSSEQKQYIAEMNLS